MFNGPLTVTGFYPSGADRTYRRRAVRGEQHRAEAPKLQFEDGARLYRSAPCAYCRISSHGGTDYCVGPDGGCPGYYF